MRTLLAACAVGFGLFLIFADETPASLLSRLTVMLNGTDYAWTVFRDRVPVARVLASDDSVPADPGMPRCRVAAVELAPDASDKPPRVALIDQAETRFGGNWMATPMRQGLSPRPDLLALCGDSIDALTREALVQALASPGAFYIRDWTEERLQIYAPQAGLAAHLSRSVPPGAALEP